MPATGNVFFVFDMPFTADGNEDTLLGVAFEDPRKAMHGRYTPQGPGTLQAEKSDKLEGKQSVPDTPNPTNVIPEHETTQATSYRASASEESRPEEPPTKDNGISYKEPGPWPKDLGPKIYSGKPIEAIGVQAITKNITDISLKVKILDIISNRLSVNESELDKTVIPVVRRYSMLDPEGKIEDLLGMEQYRDRVVHLFEQQKGRRDKRLYIATGLMACGKASRAHNEQGEQGFELELKDPTKQIPVDAGASLNHEKQKMVKAEYTSDVILAMSYHRVLYKYVPADNRNLITKLFSRKKEIPHYSRAIRYNRKDKGKDIFWIHKDSDAKGDTVPWMSCDNIADPLIDASTASMGPEKFKSLRDSAVFKDVQLYDSNTEDDLSDDDFPSNFFED